ncbi:MAG TPA: hypothetical protein VFA11_10095 [Acidimicrobiales bacterium]|nr:hypothetical protein [Acidimicrobiales bacterium]
MGDHGTTPTGRKLTDEVLEEMAREAERGLDVSKARSVRRGPGRPPVGAEAGEVFHVRLEPELRQRLETKASDEGRPAGAVVREALQRYLGPAEKRRQSASGRSARKRPASGDLILCVECGNPVEVPAGLAPGLAATGMGARCRKCRAAGS